MAMKFDYKQDQKSDIKNETDKLFLNIFGFNK